MTPRLPFTKTGAKPLSDLGSAEKLSMMTISILRSGNVFNVLGEVENTPTYHGYFIVQYVVKGEAEHGTDW